MIHKICSTSEFAYKNSITRQSEWARGWDSLGDRIDHGVGFFRVQNGHGITIAQYGIIFILDAGSINISTLIFCSLDAGTTK